MGDRAFASHPLFSCHGENRGLKRSEAVERLERFELLLRLSAAAASSDQAMILNNSIASGRAAHLGWLRMILP